MGDYPRFEPVKGSPDVACEDYYGAPAVKLLFSIIDAWIGRPKTLTLDPINGPIEIHERPSTANPARNSVEVAEYKQALQHLTSENTFSREFLLSSGWIYGLARIAVAAMPRPASRRPADDRGFGVATRPQDVVMHALRFCLAVIALTLALAGPAAAQVDRSKDQKSSRALAVKQLLDHIGESYEPNESYVESLRDPKVQKGLVAAGALNARVGHASARDLLAAGKLFRDSHTDFKGRVGPLKYDERIKLEEIYAQFETATGLKRITDPTSGVTFLLPEKLIDNAPQPTRGNEVEYRETNWAAGIGPLRLPLAQYTPIALFRERVLGSDPRDPRLERRVYKDPYLAPDEFRVLAEVTRQSDDPAVATDSYSFYDQVLTDGGQLKSIFMRYTMQRPPKSFRASDFDFLLPIVEAAAPEMDTQKRDQGVWQVLMRAVTNLIASDFPNQNGWKDVSTKDCPRQHKEAEGDDIRILFGTDRKFNKDDLESQRAESQRAGADAAKIDPDKVFTNVRGGQLHLGCAYVSTPPKGSDWSSKYTPEYRIIELEPHSTDPNELHSNTDPNDFGDRLRLTDEIGSGNPEHDRQNALVFIQGYNVSFKDALAVLAKLKWETKYRGRVYLYSWPSLVSTLSYITDLDNAEQAEPYFQSFMRMLMRDANIDEIDVLAHSAGSQTLLRTVNALRPIFDTQKELFDTQTEQHATLAQRSKSIRIGQMIFAAPDVERNVFDQKLRRIAPFAERVTVYVSSTDVALLASKFLRGGNPRAGDLDRIQTQPVQVDVDNVHIIDATGDEAWYRFDRIFFRSGSDQDYGHDYFIRNTDVVNDIKDILQSRGSQDIKTPIERAKDRFIALRYKDANGKCLQGKYYYKFISKSQMTSACEGRE